MSKRIEDALEVLSNMKDLYIKTPTLNSKTLRLKATEIIARRGVFERTVFAHLVGKNTQDTISASEFDKYAQRWLEFDSDELKKWYLRNATGKDIQRISEFFSSKGGATPEATDLNEPDPAQKILTKIYRSLRDTALARRIKAECDYRCQICGLTIYLKNKKPYAEAHHVKPLSHNGPDIRGNILCVCPNCHVQLDYRAITIDPAKFPSLAIEYINYHNNTLTPR
jgi:predicted restriction endonuclease